MSENAEVIEEPLAAEELAERFRALCADPRFANLPGKIELDLWGRMLMSPANNFHSIVQTRMAQQLFPLGGQAMVEASVLTSIGLFVADVAWASDAFMQAHGTETPFTLAPELCIEVASPSNSLKELREKVAAYLGAGAIEAWIAFPKAKRVEFFGARGSLERSTFSVDLANLFE